MKISRRALLAAPCVIAANAALAGVSDFPLYVETLPGFVPPPSLIPIGDSTATAHGVEYGFGYLWVTRISPAALVRVDRVTGSIVAITTSAPAGNDVRGVAVGQHFVAVSNLNPTYAATGGFDIVDPTSNAIVGTIAGLLGPYGMAFDAAGFLYVADGNSTTGYLRKYSISAAGVPAHVGSVQVYARPMFPALDNSGQIWVPCFYGVVGSRIAIVDTASMTLAQTYSSGAEPYECFYDGENGLMGITEHGNDSVLFFDSAGGTTRTILPPGSGAAGLRRVPGGNWYVCRSTANLLAILRAADRVHDGNISTGLHCSKVTWDGRDIWNVNSEAPATVQRNAI